MIDGEMQGMVEIGVRGGGIRAFCLFCAPRFR